MSRAAPLAAGVVALLACAKVDYLPPSPVAPWPTKVLMHRGGGDSSPYPENTLPAIRYGATRAGFAGVEVDIELSATGTLWLGHDNDVKSCAGSSIGCFQDLNDGDIDAVAYCDTQTSAPCVAGSTPTCEQRYVRLDEVFEFMAQELPESLVSLDIKGQYCRELGVGEAEEMADEVDRLVRQHGMDGKVAVETSQRRFQERIRDNHTPVYSFVVALDDIDGPLGAAARLGATGISLKYHQTVEPVTASAIAGVHGVGYRVILWTIDLPEDIAAVWPMLPDVVETDNADFMSHVPPAPAP